MAKILIKSLPEKTTPADTDVLIIEDTVTKHISLGNLLSGKQDQLTVNPPTTTATLTSLTIDGTSYAISGGSGGGDVTDVKVDGTSVVDSNNVAQINGMEKIANRVTTVTSSSDDNHYPTAKAVYDLFNSIVNLDEEYF